MLNNIELFNKAINSFLEEEINHKKKSKKVFVLRNEQSENFFDKVNTYSSLRNLFFKFYHSGYDNNLNFKIQKYDLTILWLDYSKYKINKNFFIWIKDKIKKLGSCGKYVLVKPIILPNTSFAKLEKINKFFFKTIYSDKVVFLNFLREYKSNSHSYWDLERSELFGTNVSMHGQNLHSKLLGLKYLPSIYLQKIKVIIFDLDDTLYSGTIGEDGIKKIKLDKYQTKAREYYKSLYKNGTILSICSKNNKSDIDLIFKKKFLDKKFFFPIKSNWDPKYKNIINIQKQLNISFKNILFIDNNISEILSVKKNIKDINVFWANDSASFLNCLKFYPNLENILNSNDDVTNKKRIKDLKANKKREKFFSSNKNNFKDLKMELDFRLNNHKEIERIFSLTNKVNQFIFSYKRFDKSQIREYLKTKNRFVFTISLKDKFSDSGNVAVLYFTKDNDDLILNEVCISCRALGRNLENAFIFEPVKILSRKNKIKNFFIEFKKGEKNKPAEIYFKELLKKNIKNKKIDNNKKNLFHVKNFMNYYKDNSAITRKYSIR
jgi:FkbH-like protein